MGKIYEVGWFPADVPRGCCGFCRRGLDSGQTQFARYWQISGAAAWAVAAGDWWRELELLDRIVQIESAWGQALGEPAQNSAVKGRGYRATVDSVRA